MRTKTSIARWFHSFFRPTVAITALATVGVVATPIPASPAADVRALIQARRTANQNPACALFSVDEIRKLTGFQGYSQPSPGDPPGQGAGGRASCQYQAPSFATDAKGNPITPPPGPLLSIVLMEGKNYTRTVPIGTGCKKEDVPGVGDAAFFEVCPAAKPLRTPPLYVKSGTKDFVFQIDIKAPESDGTLRPRLISLAKAAAGKAK